MSEQHGRTGPWCGGTCTHAELSASFAPITVHLAGISTSSLEAWISPSQASGLERVIRNVTSRCRAKSVLCLTILLMTIEYH
jgi:hypothetical protein